jgi:hypothetical protein
MIIYYGGDATAMTSHPEYVLGDKANIMLTYSLLRVKGNRQTARFKFVFHKPLMKHKRNKQ